MLSNNKYSFWWTPKPFTKSRSTRAQKGTPTEPYRNVMYDKRVIRGSNYGATLIELETFNKAAEWRRRNVLRKKVLTRNQRNIIGTPPPVMGRRHEVIQTDKYLEELLEYPPMRTTDTQTDLFLEAPPTPPFVAGKVGVDVGTTIEPGDFSFEETRIKSDDEELSFIDRFIEVCISDTAQEVELECGVNDHYQISEIANSQSEEILLQIQSNSKGFSSSQDRILDFVDSNEILGDIIEEIIKQRERAYESVIDGSPQYKENGSKLEADLDDNDDR